MESGLEHNMFAPGDVLAHATPDVLTAHLPSEVLSKLLSSTLAAGSKIDLVHDTLVDNRCAAKQGNANVTIDSNRGSTLDGPIYLYTQRAAGSYEYMFVVGIGN